MPKTEKGPESPIVVGRITTVFGVKGWVKVASFTESPRDLFTFQPWWLETSQGWKNLTIDEFRETAKGLQCHIKGVDDRDQARTYCQQDIWVEKGDFPSLGENQYYWHQLSGLQVISDFEGQIRPLGKVLRLQETGANDVLVVKGQKGPESIDNRERWIPYINQVIKSIDLESQQILVAWDPDF